jgi:hypothetical protein
MSRCEVRLGRRASRWDHADAGTKHRTASRGRAAVPLYSVLLKRRSSHAADTARRASFGEFVRDVVIGMSDGLTVPFAVAAGLSGAVASARVVVVAG